MKINWKVRLHNPLWIAQIALAVIIPILGYFGMTVENLTSWAVLGATLVQAVSNPYVLGLVAVSVWNAVTDPTTAGVSDSAQALTYEQPKKTA